MFTLTIGGAEGPSPLRLPPISPWQRDLIFAGIIGIWLAALGPFNNFSAGPLATRVTFHVLLAVGNFAVFRFAVVVAIRASQRLGLSPWALGFLALAGSCLPLSGLAASLGTWFFPHLKYILSPADWIVQTTILDLPIACVYAIIVQIVKRKSELQPTQVATKADNPAMPSHVPSRLGGIPICDILALGVEDHYVRIYTRGKTHLVLMTFREAVAKLRAVDGITVHRSWWVAKQAVTEVIFTGRGGHMVLWNGLRTPVSRSAIRRVKEAGLAPKRE